VNFISDDDLNHQVTVIRARPGKNGVDEAAHIAAVLSINGGGLKFDS
jgi:hypothetical protein